MRAAFLIFPLMACATVVPAASDIVRSVFENGDYVPHVLYDREIVELYGRGTEQIDNAVLSRSYSAAGCNRLLVSKTEADANSDFRIVDELEVSNLPENYEAAP